MAKRVFIVHRWEGSPRKDWYPWLKRELQKKGFTVMVPAMPHPERPTIGDWTKHLAKAVGKLDDDTYFIGHSVGCQTIIRHLATQKTACGGAVFVGGWFKLTPEATEDAASRRIAKPWLYSTIPFNAARKNLKSSIAFLSDDDPYVPFHENKEVFEKVLGAEVILRKGRGHFTGSEGATELPEALKAIVKMAK